MRGRLALLVLAAALAAPTGAQDRVMMQGFYWDAEPGGVWYDTLTTQAARLGAAGFDAIWLPPLTKGASGGYDVGYTPYDYYDLGGYDSCGGDTTQGQGGCIPTRYGTEAGLREAIQTLHARGLEVYADVVLNHRSGGSLEDNAYGRYYDWGGGSLYSDAGRTYTAFPLTHGSGRVAWTDGDEYFFPNAANNPGNTGDFYSESQLAGFHRLYTNAFAYDNALHDGTGRALALGDSLIAWGDWLTTTLGLDGYRFDYVKGIHPSYLRQWVDAGAMRGKFHVHELYDGDTGRLRTYLDQLAGSERAPAVFDFSLRFAYRDVLDGGAPIHRWHQAGLLNQYGVPFDQIVTFVDNHDFDRIDYRGQVAQADHSPVVSNKTLAYAHMLTHPGLATVWWRDYYHYGLSDSIDELIRIRKAFASGAYHALTRGETGSPYWPPSNPANPWESLYVGQRTGDGPGRGLIVAINKHPDQWAEVWVTQQNGAWAGRTLRDLTGHAGGGTTEVFADGRVRLWAPPGSYTVWVPTDYQLAGAAPRPAPDVPRYHTVDYAGLQPLAAATVAAGQPVPVAARAYVHGLTNAPGAAPGVQAWIGWGPRGTDPATWTGWAEAAYTGDLDHLDAFAATLTLPAGTYALASRVQAAGTVRYGRPAPLTVTAPAFAVTGRLAAGDAPLAGATVTLTHADTTRTAATGDDGRFAFAAVPDGAYTLTAQAAGYVLDPASHALTVAGADAQADFQATPQPIALGPLALPAGPVAVGTPVTVTADAADASGTALRARWTWGDGTPASDPSAAGTVQDGTVTGTHTYARPGLYTVTLAVANALGGTGTAAARDLVVVDPAAGFLTGGGWIASPAGALPADPAAAGKVHVTATARYAAGQATPQAQVEVRFHEAALTFRTTAAQWLVIDGPRAHLQGTGTLGDAPGYAVRLTLQDDPAGDRLRVRIWHAATGALVYDTQPGADPAAPLAAVLGGGNLTVHPGAGTASARLQAADDAPQELTLAAPYPNPVAGTATLRYGVPQAGPVELTLYTILGQQVARLSEGERTAGWHTATLDAGALAPGTYVVQLRAGTLRQVRRIVVVR